MPSLCFLPGGEVMFIFMSTRPFIDNYDAARCGCILNNLRICALRKNQLSSRVAQTDSGLFAMGGLQDQ
jgi:hypothetical protein